MLDLLLDLWRDLLEPLIRPWTTSLPLLQGAVLLLVTILVLLVMFHRRIFAWFGADPHSRDHDVTLFKHGETLVNEQKLDQLLNHNLYNRWCAFTDIQAVATFCREYSRVENQFLDRRVREATKEAIRALAAVSRHVSRTFFTSMNPDNQGLLYLYPELKNSEDPEKRAVYTSGPPNSTPSP